MKKYLLFAIGPLGAAILSLITLPVLTWMFDQEVVGQYSMLNVVVSLSLLFFTLGLDQAYVREYHNEDNKIELIKAVLFPCFIVFFIFVILGLWGWNKLSNFIFNSDDINYILLLMSIILFSVVGRFLSISLRMNLEGFKFSMSQLIPKLILVLALLGMFLFDVPGNIEYLIYIVLLGYVFLVLYLFLVLDFPLLSFLKCKTNLSLAYKLLKFGWPLIIGSLAYWGLTASDKVFLKNMVGLDAVAVYSVAVSLSSVALIFQSILSTIWSPVILKWVKYNDKLSKEKIDFINHFNRLVTLISVFLFTLFGVFSWLIPYILPEEYADVGGLVLILLSPPVFYTLSEITVVGIAISKKTIYSMYCSIFALVVNVVLNFILIPDYGYQGAAIATAVSFWLFYVFRTQLSSKLWFRFSNRYNYLITLFLLVISILNLFLSNLYYEYFVVCWILMLIVSVCFSYKTLIYFFRKIIVNRNMF